MALAGALCTAAPATEVAMAKVRRIFLFPEASRTLAALMPELESHILAPHQLLAVTFPDESVEESGLGIWVPALEAAGGGVDAAHANARILLPWRFIATMMEYEDPGVEASRPKAIGFSRAERVG
jgi:hypothetical protein